MTSTLNEAQKLRLSKSPEKIENRLESTSPKNKQLRIAKGLEGENPSPNVSIFDEPTDEVPNVSICGEPTEETPMVSIFDEPTQETPMVSIFDEPTEDSKVDDKEIDENDSEREDQEAPEDPMGTMLEITVPQEDQFTSEDEETVASPREPKRSEKSTDQAQDEDSPEDNSEPPEQKSNKPLHPEDKSIRKLFTGRACFAKLEEGECKDKECEATHEFTPDSIFDFYKIIRSRGHEHLLPKSFKPQIPKRQIERLLSIYQNNIKKIIVTDKALAVSWLHDVLEDLKDLAYEKDTIFEVCRQLNREFAELFPSNHFVDNYCSGQIQDLRTITAVMEKFVMIAHKIRNSRNRQLPIDLAYSELHKSMQCGLTLHPQILEYIWDIFLDTSDKQHLPTIANYVMLRPDTYQVQFIRFLCNTFQYIYSMKETAKPRIMRVLKPTLMAMDMKLFASHTRESIQSLANFLSTHIETYPEFIEVLERMKMILGDLVIIPEISPMRIDMATENQILALIEDKKWAHIALMYLDKNILKIHDWTDFVMILFRLFTEVTDDECNPYGVDGPINIINEIYLKRRKLLLPIDKLVLGQFMASLILHHYEDIPMTTKLVQTSFKYGLELFDAAPLFNPKAESVAIQTKRNRNDVRVLVVRAFIVAPELDHFRACDWLVLYFQEFMATQKHDFIYGLITKLFDTLIEVKDQAQENQLEKYCLLFDKCLLPFHVDADIAKYYNSMIHTLIGAVHRIKNYGILVSLIYPQLEYFQNIVLTDESTIRGIVHMFQGSASNSEALIWAEKAFTRGLQIRAYPIQEVQYKEILIYSHYSQNEMHQIIQDAFSKVFEDVGNDKILEMYRAVEDGTFDDKICKLDYIIRVENAGMPPKTSLPFLSVFDVSTPKTVRRKIAFKNCLF